LAGQATYLYGGRTFEQDRVMAPYLLHWEAMLNAKQRRGCRLYDFYGYSADPRHSYFPFSRFKKQFGGFPLSYPGAMTIIFTESWPTPWLISSAISQENWHEYVFQHIYRVYVLAFLQVFLGLLFFWLAQRMYQLVFRRIHINEELFVRDNVPPRWPCAAFSWEFFSRSTEWRRFARAGAESLPVLFSHVRR